MEEREEGRKGGKPAKRDLAVGAMPRRFHGAHRSLKDATSFVKSFPRSVEPLHPVPAWLTEWLTLKALHKSPSPAHGSNVFDFMFKLRWLYAPDKRFPSLLRHCGPL